MTDKDHNHPDEDNQVEKNHKQNGAQECAKEHSRVLMETAIENTRLVLISRESLLILYVGINENYNGMSFS